MRKDEMLRIAVKALKEMACLDDEMANVQAMAHGSFSAFDEPNSVRFARETLRKMRVPFELKVKP